MLFWKNKTEAQRDSLILFWVRISNFSSFSDNVSPEDVASLLRINASACRRIFQRANGAIVSNDGIETFAVYPDLKTDHANCIYHTIAFNLVHTLRGAIAEYKTGMFNDVSITVSVGKGVCVFEKKGKEYRHVLGEVVNRLTNMAAQHSNRTSRIVFDESVKPFFKDAKPQLLTNDIYEIVVPPEK